jgi:hypothetical protein
MVFQKMGENFMVDNFYFTLRVLPPAFYEKLLSLHAASNGWESNSKFLKRFYEDCLDLDK